MARWPPKELSLIGQGLSEFVVNYSNLKSTEIINVHGNLLPAIPDFKNLHNLREIDLSSNRIGIIRGLESLSSLQVVNLSCNFIKKVEGLSCLKSLLKINLSHNQIEDLSGFMAMEGQSYALTIVNLCDNRINRFSHLVACFRNCTNLRDLSLSCRDGLTNPVCEMDDYRARLLSRLSQLFVLDGISRDGQSVDDVKNGFQKWDVMNCPKHFLEDLMIQSDHDDDDDDVIVHNQQATSKNKVTMNEPAIISGQTKNTKSQGSIQEINTPRIDNIIMKYSDQNRSDNSSITKSDKNIATEVGISSDFEKNTSTENQSEMFGVSLDSASSTSPSKSSAGSMQKTNSEKGETSIQSRHSKTHNSSSLANKKNVAAKVKTTSCTKAPTNFIGLRSSQINGGHKNTEQSKVKTKSKKHIIQIDQTDQEYRDVIETTYNDLIEELNAERSERLKAELALKELTTFVNEIQEQSRKTDRQYETVFQENTFLKETLANEKETVKKLEGDLLLVTQDNADIGNQLKVSEKSLQNQKILCENLQKLADEGEKANLEELAKERKKTKKYQSLTTAVAKEVQESKSMVSLLQKRVKELEQLLTTRELAHKEELTDRYKLGSEELKLVIDDKIKDVRIQQEERMKLRSQREEMMQKHYKEITAELNYALRLESGQVTKLETAYELISKENELNKQALMAVKVKEKKAVETVSQLANVVKKQKEQISDLLKSKENLEETHKEEVTKMESQLNEAKKNLNNLSKIKQDRLKLEAQVEAQESLIVGLRAERKMWENELAQQGTSLAQDRGRLEVKIETFSTEIEYLKKQLKSEVDTVKIKSKVIDDQMDSIKLLKVELSQKEKLIQEIHKDTAISRKKIEDELALEQDALQESQLTIQRLQERKSELKDEISRLEMELTESKNAHKILKEHWQQKSDVISALEVQVKQAKSSWEKREKDLKAECEKARQEAKESGEKLQKADNAFRRQIAEKEKGQRMVISQLKKDHQSEMELANRRMLELEEEMREILKDSSHMQEKMAKLAEFFGNIATELSFLTLVSSRVLNTVPTFKTQPPGTSHGSLPSDFLSPTLQHGKKEEEKKDKVLKME